VCSPGATATDTAQALQSHQSRDAMTAHPDPTSLQILMDPRTPIPAACCLIAGPNLRHQPLILLRAYPERTTAPRVESTAGHPEDPTGLPSIQWTPVVE